MPPDWTTQADLTVTLDGKKTFNVIMFQEQIRYYSQRIAKFAVDVHKDGQWQQVAKGQTVGYKKICRTKDVKTNKLRIRIQDARLSPTIANLALFHAPPLEKIISN
jgi:alpha-L-fucosidase